MARKITRTEASIAAINTSLKSGSNRMGKIERDLECHGESIADHETKIAILFDRNKHQPATNPQPQPHGG